MKPFLYNYAQLPKPDPKPISRPALLIYTSNSTGFAAYVILLHTFAALMVVLTPDLPWAITALLGLMIYLNAQAMLQQHPPATLIIWHANNQIQLHCAYAANTHAPQAAIMDTTLTQGSTHNSWFILLRLKPASQGPRCWLIARDAVSDKDFRRMRARLSLDNQLSLIEQ